MSEDQQPARMEQNPQAAQDFEALFGALREQAGQSVSNFFGLRAAQDEMRNSGFREGNMPGEAELEFGAQTGALGKSLVRVAHEDFLERSGLTLSEDPLDTNLYLTDAGKFCTVLESIPAELVGDGLRTSFTDMARELLKDARDVALADPSEATQRRLYYIFQGVDPPEWARPTRILYADTGELSRLGAVVRVGVEQALGSDDGESAGRLQAAFEHVGVDMAGLGDFRAVSDIQQEGELLPWALMSRMGIGPDLQPPPNMAPHSSFNTVEDWQPLARILLGTSPVGALLTRVSMSVRDALHWHRTGRLREIETASATMDGGTEAESYWAGVSHREANSSLGVLNEVEDRLRAVLRAQGMIQ